MPIEVLDESSYSSDGTQGGSVGWDGGTLDLGWGGRVAGPDTRGWLPGSKTGSAHVSAVPMLVLMPLSSPPAAVVKQEIDRGGTLWHGHSCTGKSSLENRRG